MVFFIFWSIYQFILMHVCIIDLGPVGNVCINDATKNSTYYDKMCKGFNDTRKSK